MAYSTNDSGLTTTGVIQASDLQAIADYYRQWFSVDAAIPATGQSDAAWIFNGVRQSILNGMGNSWSANLPGTVNSGDLVRSTFWPKPTPTFQTFSQNYTSPGTYTFTIPPGCDSIYMDVLMAGGGGGGTGMEQESGGGGGGGGSGGWIIHKTFGVSWYQTVTIVVGAGGGAGQNGGDSYVAINGNIVYRCGGGGAGGNAGPFSGGSGGGGGSGDGSNGGGAGQTGNSGHASSAGGNGGDGVWGGGGAGGSPGADWQGKNATNYGGGGGGGGSWDRHDPLIFPGGSGSPGFVSMQYTRGNY